MYGVDDLSLFERRYYKIKKVRDIRLNAKEPVQRESW